jgi:hypothetical protein
LNRSDGNAVAVREGLLEEKALPVCFEYQDDGMVKFTLQFEFAGFLILRSKSDGGIQLWIFDREG